MYTLKNQTYYYDMESGDIPVVENLNTSNPDWILYNGSWDDNGSWYDTSYWIDGISDIIFSTDVAFSGSNSLKILDNSSQTAYRTQFFNIKSTRVNPVKISSWVYTSSSASTTNLCGVGIFNDQNETTGSFSEGYYAVVDFRSGTGSTAGFQIRKKADTMIESDDSISISTNTWYKVELYIDENNNIIANLYNTDLTLISTLSSSDTDYGTGYFALTNYEVSYFDDVHILGDKEVSITSLEWLTGYEKYYYELSVVNPSDTSQIIAYVDDYSELDIRKVFNEVNEIEFTLPYYVDSEVNNCWEKIYENTEIVLSIKIDDMVVNKEGYVVDISELYDGDKPCKKIHAYSKDYKLGKKKVIDFPATTRLYSSTVDWATGGETNSGILNYILEVKLQNTWTVSYMSSSLVDVQRTFDISNKSVLEVIREIQEQFNCTILFDTENNTVSIKTYDEVGENKGLIIDINNYIKTLGKQIKIDEIVTRLYVEGDKLTTISGINITGQSYLDDFSFFKSTTYMSQDLIDALDAYETLKSGYEGTFAGYVSDLSTAQGELTVLEGELSTLENELIIIQDALDECIKFGTSGGQSYTYWRGQESTKEGEITTKEGEITTKEGEITTIQANMAGIVTALSYETNFTTDELQELNGFIYEDVVKCNTEDEEILLEYGEAILANRSQPPIEFSIDLVDIFGSQEQQFAWEKLSLGDLVTVTHEEFNIDSEVRVMSYNYSPTGSNLRIDFSNKQYWNDELNYLNDIIRKSKQVADTSDKERFEYKDYYENDKETIDDFITSPIDTSDNEVLVGGGATLNRRGLLMRDVSSSLGQMKILGNRIVFTQDNWDSYSLAITPDGVQTTGEFKLYSENSYGGQNIVQIDGNGIAIYGSETAGEGLIIYNKDDTEVFSLDTSGNIIMTGNITMNGGSIDWGEVASDPAIATAQSAADDAQADADTANTLLADIADDNKITPSEKQALKKEWDAILSEKVLNVAQASEFSVSSTDYVTAYNALYAYVVTDNNLLSDLTTTSTIVGTTFRSKFKDYYDERVDLLNEIADKNKTQIGQIVDGTYSGGTFIDGTLIYSPTILNTKSGLTDEGSLDTSIRFWAGDTYTNRAIAPFKVTQGGAVICSNLSITGGTGVQYLDDAGALARAENLDDVGDGVNYFKTTYNEKQGAGFAYTGLDVSGSLTTKVIPNSPISTPSSAGLYLGSDYLGYHDGFLWKTYIKSNGDFGFQGDGSNYITWDGTTLDVRGNLNASDITAGTIDAAYISTEISQVNDTLNLGSTSSRGSIVFESGVSLISYLSGAFPRLKVSAETFVVNEGNLTLGNSSGYTTDMYGDINFGTSSGSASLDFTYASVTGTKKIHVGTTAPTDTDMLWLDTN